MGSNSIKIHIASGFDPSGVRDASESIEKLRLELLKSNREISQAIHNRAAEVAVDYAAVADKGVAHSVLSAKEIEAAWAKAMGKVPVEAGKGFGALTNIAKGAAKGLGGVFSGVAEKLFNGGMWEAGAMLVAKGIQGIVSAVTENAKKAWEKVRRISEDSAKRIADDIKSVNDSMREQLATIDRIVSRRKDELAAVRELTKAEIELAKQHAIANGMDPIAANAAAADLSAIVDEEAEEQRLNDLIDERKKKIEAAGKAEKDAQKAVADATAAKAKAEAEYQKKRDEYIKANSKDYTFHGTTYGGVWLATEDNSAGRRAKEGMKFDESEAGKKLRSDLKIDEFNREIGDANKIAAEAKNAKEESEAAIKNARVALDTLAAKRESRELAAQNEIAAKVEEEERKRDEMAEKAAEAARKAADEELKARQKAEDELHKQRLANIKAEMDARKAAASEAEKTVAAAKSEFDKAFAMYRDPERAKSEIAEERDYSGDLKRLQKDAARYGGKWRIDELASLMAAGDTRGQAAKLEEWRKSRSFTPEVEAMVRASAAQETRTVAEDELRKLNATVANTQKMLGQLLTMKGGN